MATIADAQTWCNSNDTNRYTFIDIALMGPKKIHVKIDIPSDYDVEGQATSQFKLVDKNWSIIDDKSGTPVSGGAAQADFTIPAGKTSASIMCYFPKRGVGVSGMIHYAITDVTSGSGDNPDTPISPTGWAFRGSPKKVLQKGANLLTDFNNQIPNSALIDVKNQYLANQVIAQDASGYNTTWHVVDVGPTHTSLDPELSVAGSIGVTPSLRANRIPNSTMIHKALGWDMKANTNVSNLINPYTGNYTIAFGANGWSYCRTNLWTPSSDDNFYGIHAYVSFWAQLAHLPAGAPQIGIWFGRNNMGSNQTIIDLSKFATTFKDDQWYLFWGDLGDYSISPAFDRVRQANQVITNSYSMTDGLGGLMSDFSVVFTTKEIDLNSFNVFATPTGGALH